MLRFRPYTWAFLIAAISVLFVVGFLRFFSLGSVPKGMTQDEAYYLYDAYSIKQTGKDLWGVRLPLMFKSTGEYKLNLTYLISGSINLVGLNTQAARFPSAIAGYLTLFVLYFTVYELTRSRSVSLISVAILAFTPWHFGMSRLFYESNVGLFFISVSLLMALQILRRSNTPKTSAWVVMTLSAALSAYFYGAFRYLGLWMVLVLQLIYFFKNRVFSKAQIIGLLVYLVVMIPVATQMFSKAGLMRLSQESKLHQFGYELTINEARSNCYLISNKNLVFSKICYAFWNKPVLYLEQIASTGIKLLSPEYLFFKSYDQYIVPEDHGSYLPYLLVFYLLGIFVFIRSLLRMDVKSLYIGATLAGSIGVVSTLGSVVYHRNVVGLFIITILMSLGINWLFKVIETAKSKKIIYILVMIVILALGVFQTTKYLLYYFTTYSVKTPLLTKYDAPDIYKYLESYKDYTIYDNIFFAPIYAGIYWQLDPVDFQRNAKWADPDKWGFTNADHWNNLHFKGTNMEKLLCQKNKNPSVPIKTLLVDDATGHYFPYASFVSHNFSGSLDLHAVYDIDKLYEVAKIKFPGDLCK